MLELNKIYFEDCLVGMQKIDDKSIDCIICDLPFGVTACGWDLILPFDILWSQYNRIIKDKSAIVLFATQPFTTKLVSSNIDNFKYSWIWNKKSVSNPQLAKKQPLKCHEDIIVFSNGSCCYFPQDLQPYSRKRKKDSSSLGHCVRKDYEQTVTNYPKSIIEFSVERGLHPTQKPILLIEYLIKTYTNEEDLVLDSCIGSGTTALAARNLNRNFIGFENNEEYFKTAQKRLNLV